MRKTVRRRHEAHVRVQSVCAEHSAVFDATPGGKQTRADFDAQVGEVDRLLMLQGQSIDDRRGATEDCRRARKALRDAIKAVVNVGRIARLDESVMGKLQLAGSTSDEELLAYARGLLERVSANADVFVAKGLPPDLPKRLAEAIQAVGDAREVQAGSRQRFTAAFDAMRDTLDESDKTIDVLQSIVVNTPGAPPELLSRLRIARRVGPRVAAPPKVTPAPQPPPADKAA